MVDGMDLRKIWQKTAQLKAKDCGKKAKGNQPIVRNLKKKNKKNLTNISFIGFPAKFKYSSLSQFIRVVPISVI